jgi:predicted phage-related endonuclease
MSTVPLTRGDEARSIQAFGRAPRTSAIPLLPPDASDADWKALRRKGVGASEMSVLLDVSPYSSRFALWWQKREGWEIEGTDGMRIGTRLEPVIRECFLDRFPDALLLRAGARLWAHPTMRHMLCTPDYLAVFPDDPTRVIPIECKSDETNVGWGYDGEPVVPQQHAIQAKMQALIFGSPMAYVAHLKGKRFTVHPLELTLNDSVEWHEWERRARTFLASIDVGTPPPVDGHEATSETLQRLYPVPEEDEPAAVLDQALADQYRDAGRRLAILRGQYRELQNRVRWDMGKAKEARDESGELVATRVHYKRREYSVAAGEVDRLNPA